MKLNPTVILKTIYSANMTFFANTKKKIYCESRKGWQDIQPIFNLHEIFHIKAFFSCLFFIN